MININKVSIKRASKDYPINWVKWIVSSGTSSDLCDNFLDALRCFFWRLGIPAKIAFRKYKKKKK